MVICGSRRRSLELCRRRHNSNYAEVAVMPTSYPVMVFVLLSVLGGVGRAA